MIKKLLLILFVAILSFSAQAYAVPVADDASFETPQGTQVNGDLSDLVSGFIDPDFSTISPPLHGTVILNTETGAFGYQPNVGYVGPDSFRYGAGENSPSPLDTGLISIDVCQVGACTPGRVITGSVPEPASVMLLLFGLGGVALRLYRRHC